MSYYLLRVNKPGSLAYKTVADARHHIEAHSLEKPSSLPTISSTITTPMSKRQ